MADDRERNQGMKQSKVNTRRDVTRRMIAPPADVATIRSALKNATSDSIRAEAAMVAPTKKAARTKRPDVKGGAVHTGAHA